MPQTSPKRFRRLGARPVVLAADLAAGAAYVAGLAVLRSLTRAPRLDGIIGVVLGLAIGSHPAMNLLDMLIYWRIEGPLYSGRRTIAWWLALNGIVLAAAAVVIAFGASRFALAPRP